MCGEGGLNLSYFLLMPHRGDTRGREGPGGHRDWSDVAISQEMPAAAPAG